MMTQRARHAFKALFRLARADGQALSASELAAADSIPRAFLDQILNDLRHAGFVQSRRGRVGGYFMDRPTESITLADIVRAVDGPIAPLPCLSKTAYRSCADCPDEAACTLRHVFSDVYERLLSGLEAVTLADALNRAEAAGRASHQKTNAEIERDAIAEGRLIL
jgi:Rrf2 family protein